MEPIGIIMTALTLGIAAGLKPSAEQAVKDAYRGLKQLTEGRYGVSLSNLENTPESKAQQAAVEESLAKADDIDQDGELLDKAKMLIDLVKAHDTEIARAEALIFKKSWGRLYHSEKNYSRRLLGGSQNGRCPRWKWHRNWRCHGWWRNGPKSSKAVDQADGSTAYTLKDVSVSGDLHVGPKHTSAYTDPERSQLETLVDRVKKSWGSVLEQAIHQAALIDLDLSPRPEAIDHPQKRVLKIPNTDLKTLRPDKKIGHIFMETSRLLLILGEAGSGKTLTLLMLLEDLIDRFEQDEALSEPAPVYVNLSTWTMDKSLMDWLVAELSDQYIISNKKMRQTWLEQNRLVLLLDGLDEVRVDHRAACVEAINQFGAEFGLSGLAVCSRL